ncbi:MAG: hypothetical protein GY754_31400 [bacterium]|nr:hypothetical protein [bacterium]
MLQKRRKLLVIAVIMLLILATGALSNNKKLVYKIINIELISNFKQDRIAFQHIEKKYDEDLPFTIYDNSVASLLIIRDSKMYLFKDGYDSNYDVRGQKKILEMENRMIPDLWSNKIDNNPDFVTITDRKLSIMRKVALQDAKPGEENTTPKNLADNYIKMYSEVRSTFLKAHVKKLMNLMINDKENIYVTREPIPKRAYDTGETKYCTRIAAKTINKTLYYAEDGDGDGITETFTAGIRDGFDWGGEAGPNIILIYKCKFFDKDKKPINPEIKEIVGSITKQAYFGTEIEEKNLGKAMEKEKENIKEMIEDIYLFDSKKYMKK